MKTWVIMGPSNVGKTETIKMIERSFFNNKSAVCCFYDKDKNGVTDIISIHEYKNQLIGFISFGDHKEGIENAYNVIKMKVKKLNYLICASRTKENTIEYVQSLSNDIVKIRKSYLNTEDQNIISKYKDQLNKDLANYIYDNIINEIN